MREAVQDKSYRAYPMGQLAGEYMRFKRGRITPSTYRSYESTLDKLARAFPDLEIGDFEPPIGTQRIEEFMDDRWGLSAPGTYNTNLAVIRDFFRWAVLRGKLHGDPCLPLESHKKRDTHREIFGSDIRARIYADGPDPTMLRRDRVALRLLLDYGIRKGALQKIQLRHFDHNRRRLTIFTKGLKVRELLIPDSALWDDLEKYILETYGIGVGLEVYGGHYLIYSRRKMNAFRGYDRVTGKAKTEPVVREYRDRPFSAHALHDWWYGCLERAGIVAAGTRSGEKMHKARHTAGQRVLDATGNLKAAQRLLGHASIATTGNIYADWDIDQLAETMKGVLGVDE